MIFLYPGYRHIAPMELGSIAKTLNKFCRF